MKATIFDIERSSFVDGPGIRTTVFFKGCNLRCKWCHNPESHLLTPQMMLYQEKCIGCEKCKEKCPNNQSFCDLCGKCALYCPQNARKICGKEYSVDQVFDEIIKDKMIYESSGGGVTFSGGECMLQIGFLKEILKKCKEHGINTAVDTAGNVPWECFERIVSYTDLFLYDIKCFSNALHIDGTGVSNGLIIENLRMLSKNNIDIIVRIPVIPEFNGNNYEMNKMADLLKQLNIRKVQLLPYHSMGEHKWAAIAKKVNRFSIPSESEIIKLKNAFFTF